MVILKTKNWIIDDFDTVLFDKDGTFIDLHYFWGKMTEMRSLEIIKQFNLSKDFHRQICLYLGYDVHKKKMLSNGITALYSRCKIIEIFKENLLELGICIDESNLSILFDNVSYEFYKNITLYIKPIKHSIEFIKELKACGVKLGIVTSDSIESTNLTIEYLNLKDIFDVIIGRESSVETKESGVLTKLALKGLKTGAETTVMIGDAPMDYYSAKNAGIEKTILVSTGQIDKSELVKYTSCAVDSLAEINIIKQ